MDNAVHDVLAKRMGFLKTVKSYDVQKATRIDYVKKVNIDETLDNLLNRSQGRQRILIPEV